MTLEQLEKRIRRSDRFLLAINKRLKDLRSDAEEDAQEEDQPSLALVWFGNESLTGSWELLIEAEEDYQRSLVEEATRIGSHVTARFSSYSSWQEKHVKEEVAPSG